MTRVKALIIMDSHIRRFYKFPRKRHPTEMRLEHMQKIYAYAAAKELRKLVETHRDWEPINAVEEFRYSMDYLATASKDPAENFRLSVAYDTASDILDILLDEGGK